MSYIVKLKYFKNSGKYYADGEFETFRTNIFDIFNEVRTKLKERILPGLVRGASFITLIDIPDHPDNRLRILIPMNFEKRLKRHTKFSPPNYNNRKLESDEESEGEEADDVDDDRD